MPLQNGITGLSHNTQHLEPKRKNQPNPNLVIIKSSDVLNMLDDNSMEFLSYQDLRGLCILATLDLQLERENESTSNRRNLC